MIRLAISLAVGLLVSVNLASAAERTVTLTVENMYCEACPYIVKKTLEHVSGVSKATVSFNEKTAIVTYDDGKTDVNGLIAATTNAGYPSTPKS